MLEPNNRSSGCQMQGYNKAIKSSHSLKSFKLGVGDAEKQLVLVMGYGAHDTADGVSSDILRCGRQLVDALFSTSGLLAHSKTKRVQRAIVLFLEGNNYRRNDPRRKILRTFRANNLGMVESLRFAANDRPQSYYIKDSDVMDAMCEFFVKDSMHLKEPAKVTQGMLIVNAIGCVTGKSMCCDTCL